MNNIILHPLVMLNRLVVMLQVMTGQQQLQGAYKETAENVWQVIIAHWLLSSLFTILFTMFLIDQINVLLFMNISLISLISVLMFITVLGEIFKYCGQKDLFIGFIIPYMWAQVLQVVLVGMLLGVMLLTGVSTLQLFILPLFIWFLYWLIQIVRQKSRFSGWIAVGFVFLRVLIEVLLGLLFRNGMLLE